MRTLLKIIIKILAKIAIKKYNPIVIGVTGSVGKTSAKEAIFRVLKEKFNVRANDANFNNEIGFPMTILGLRKIGSKFIWLINILKAIKLIIFKDKFYPEILILEMAADHPGDIDYLLDICKPHIGVVTAVGEIPVHVEFYNSPEEVAKEKGKLIKSLSSNGLALLNYDDPTVYEMKNLTKAKVLSFGFGKNADLVASDIFYFFEGNQGFNNQIWAGITFKLNYRNSLVPVRLNNALGRHQIYSALISAGIGLYFGLNLVEISKFLEDLKFPKQRMNILKGNNNTLIIDDSYNASPLSMHAALDTLADFGDKVIEKLGFGRKIAILGDMLELGEFTEKAHRQIGNLAGEKVDCLFTVGLRAKFIADSAFNQLPKENVFRFDNTDEAISHIKEFVKEGDIILIKGSRAMKMEKIVKALSENGNN